jgi:hypothetical protein
MQMIGWLLCALAVAGATRLDGQQVRFRSELVATSGHLWRGIMRNRYPVVQPFVGVELTARRFELGVAGWASGIFHSGRCGPPACPENAGFHFADVNGSLLARYLRGNTQWALGLNGYHFPYAPFTGIGGSATTWEIVGSVYAVPDRHIQLALTGWYDFKEVEGFYIEATGTMPIVLKKSRTPQMFITATGGWSRGQHISGGKALGYFERNGFTHVSVEVSWLPLHPDPNESGTTVQLFFRLQGNLDPATKGRVWPLGNVRSEQQFVFGFAVHPVKAHPPKRAPDM